MNWLKANPRRARRVVILSMENHKLLCVVLTAACFYKRMHFKCIISAADESFQPGLNYVAAP